MKKLKFNSGILAVIIGGAMAFAGTPVKSTGTLYGKINGVWTNIESRPVNSYMCDGETDQCKARFSTTPNQSGSNYDPGTLENGVFTEL